MHDQPRRRRGPAAMVAVAGALALGGAVTAGASAGSSDASDASGVRTQAVQDSQREQAPNTPDGKDCPERDGSGSGSGSAAPQDATPEGTATPDV